MRLCISYCLVQSICGCNWWRCPHWSSYPPICWLGKHHHNISRISPRFTSVNSVRRPFRMAIKKWVGTSARWRLFFWRMRLLRGTRKDTVSLLPWTKSFWDYGTMSAFKSSEPGVGGTDFYTKKTKKRNMRKGSQLFLERSHVLMFSWHFGRVVSRKKPMASTWWEVVESSKISKHLCGFGAICTLRFLFVCASSDLI